MKRRLTQISLLILVRLFFIADVYANQCTPLEQPDGQYAKSAANLVPVTIGLNEISFLCDADEPSVLRINTTGVDDITPLNNAATIQSSSFAFHVPAGKSQLDLRIHASVNGQMRFELDTFPAFNAWSLTHTLTMGLFVGISFSLCVYVGMLGRGMREASLYSYSAYILSACLFFVLQEKLLRLVFPDLSQIHDVYTLSFFAGLTVLTGQQFVTRILEFKRILPAWIYWLLNGLGIGIFVVALVPFLFRSPTLFFLHGMMGSITSAIIIIIIPSNIWAIYKRIRAARAVFICQLILAVSMFIRLYMNESAVFLAQYSLIFGLTAEAFILAIAVSSKVQNLREQNAIAQTTAAMDELCPVLNRRGWYQAAQRSLDEADNHDGVVALIFVDLDKFKHINDTFGHAAGDKVLIAASKIIQHQSRSQDVVGRIGGDEFVVLAQFNVEVEALKRIKRLETRLYKLVLDIDGQQITVSASVGYQIQEFARAELSELMRLSDKNMYATKASRTAV